MKNNDSRFDMLINKHLTLKRKLKFDIFHQNFILICSFDNNSMRDRLYQNVKNAFENSK